MMGVFLIFLVFVSVFSVGVYAQDVSDNPTTTVTFDPDVAGVTPDRWYYPFIDWTHSPEESLAEAGLMAESGDYDAYQKAVENFNEEVEKERVTDVFFEGVTIGSIASNEEVQRLLGVQENLLNYRYYINEIKSVFETQIEEGAIERDVAEDAIDEANTGVADVGAGVEEQRLILIDEIETNSDVSRIEAEIKFEDVARDIYGGRFEEISRINDIQEARDKIVALRREADDLEEAGDEEKASQVRALVELGESHLTNCLHADENDLNFAADSHLRVVEDLVLNAERFIDNNEIVFEGVDSGSVIYRNPETGLIVGPSVEDIRNEINGEKEETAKLIDEDYYEKLKEKYAGEPGRLKTIIDERARAVKIEGLGKSLYEEGVMDKWIRELTDEGLSEEERQVEIGKRWSDERRALYGEDYVPIGLYDIKNKDVSKEGGPNPEIIGIGRIEFVDEVDENGNIVKKVVGWWDGAFADVGVAGGVVQNYKYTDFENGYKYSFGPNGYSYETRAGIIGVVSYIVPDGEKSFRPENLFNNGDEKYSYSTEDGKTVTYTSTGVLTIDSEGNVEEQVYGGQDKFVVVGSSENGGYGGTVDFEPDGYVVTNVDGEATKWQATPELTVVDSETEGEENKIITYYNDVDGKVFVNDVAPHEGIVFGGDGKYSYNYGGIDWIYNSEENVWTSELGAIPVKGAPAPIGSEDKGSVRTSEGIYVYDKLTDSWSLPTGEKFTVPPNMRYNPDITRGGYWGVKGEFYPFSGDEFAVKDSYSQKDWSFDIGTNTWKSSNDIYNPKDGTITKPDGTVIGPENRPAGQGSDGCYGCYSDSSGQMRVSNYAGYGGNHVYDPIRNTYFYVSPRDSYYGGFKPGDIQSDYLRRQWVMDSNGVWVDKESAETGITKYNYATPVTNYYNFAVSSKNFNYFDPETGAVYDLPSRIGPNQEGVDYSQYKVKNPQGYDSSLGEGYFNNDGNWVSVPGSRMYGPAGTAYDYGVVAALNAYSVPVGGFTDDMNKAAQAQGFADAAAQAAYYSSGSSYSSGAPVGTSVVYNGETYTVTSDKGWTLNGAAVAPPPGQPSSAVYSGTSGSYGYYSGASSSSASGGGYYNNGVWQQYTLEQATAAAQVAAGSYYGGYVGSSGYYSYPAFGSPGSAGYMPPSGGYYDSSGNWQSSSSGTDSCMNNACGGYNSPEAYAAATSGSSYTGTYSGSGDSGAYIYSGSSTGDSGSYSAPSGDSGSSTGGSTGGDGGGGGTPAVIAEEDAQLQSGNWIINLWKKFTGFFVKD